MFCVTPPCRTWLTCIVILETLTKRKICTMRRFTACRQATTHPIFNAQLSKLVLQRSSRYFTRFGLCHAGRFIRTLLPCVWERASSHGFGACLAAAARGNDEAEPMDAKLGFSFLLRHVFVVDVCGFCAYQPNIPAHTAIWRQHARQQLGCCYISSPS
jgi:hypothetical protein